MEYHCKSTGLLRIKDLYDLELSKSSEWGEYKNRGGIYVWGIIFPGDKFIPVYTGKSSSKPLKKRIHDHFENLHFDNKYKIFSAECFEKFHSEGDDFQNRIITREDNPKITNTNSLIYENDFDFLTQSLNGALRPNSLDNVTITELKKYRDEVNANNEKGRWVPQVNFSSQTFDLILKSNGKMAVVQPVIEKYFSLERFGFIFFYFDDIKNKSLGDEESAVKSSLIRNTISQASQDKEKVIKIDYQLPLGIKIDLTDLFPNKNVI